MLDMASRFLVLKSRDKFLSKNLKYINRNETEALPDTCCVVKHLRTFSHYFTSRFLNQAATVYCKQY